MGPMGSAEGVTAQTLKPQSSPFKPRTPCKPQTSKIPPRPPNYANYPLVTLVYPKIPTINGHKDSMKGPLGSWYTLCQTWAQGLA